MLNKTAGGPFVAGAFSKIDKNGIRDATTDRVHTTTQYCIFHPVLIVRQVPVAAPTDATGSATLGMIVCIMTNARVFISRTVLDRSTVL